MSKAGRVIGVLLLGVNFQLPGRTFEEMEATGGGSWSISFHGPALAIFVYGVLAAVVLFRVLNALPGVLALNRPLGRVQSGFEYLWLPAIVATFAGLQYRGRISGRENPETAYWSLHYGSVNEAAVVLSAFGVFVLLMWSLKLHTAMVAANRRLVDEPPADAVPSV